VKYVEGCRPDNSIDGFCTNFAFNNHNILAYYDYSATQLRIIVDDGPTGGVDYVFEYTLDIGLNQFDGVVEFYPKNGNHNNIFYPVRGFRTASRSFVDTGVGPSKKSKKQNKEVSSMLSMLDIELPTKGLSEFNKTEQTKILRQQKTFENLHEIKRIRK